MEDENSKDTVWWTSEGYPNDNHRASKATWEAVKKLAQEELSVMEIAGMVGYENCSKFAAAFRGEYGVSPSGYRKQHRKGISEA